MLPLGALRFAVFLVAFFVAFLEAFFEAAFLAGAFLEELEAFLEAAFLAGAFLEAFFAAFFVAMVILLFVVSADEQVRSFDFELGSRNRKLFDSGDPPRVFPIMLAG